MLLVTGANSLLGARCVERFARVAGDEILAVWHDGRDRLLSNPPGHVQYERCDLTDRSQVEQLFARSKIERVLHAAALLPDDRPGYLARAVRANVLATADLAECARSHGCRRFVYCSSISVYGAAPCGNGGWREVDAVRPAGDYGWSKFAGEECVRLCVERGGGMEGVSLRLAGLHGPGRAGGVVYHMLRAAKANQPLQVYHPRNRFQLLFLDDAVDAVGATLQQPMPAPYCCINVASHVLPSMKELAERIIAICNSRSIAWLVEADGGEQIMNTTAATQLLALHPPAIDSRLREMAAHL